MEPNWSRLDDHVRFYLPVLVAVVLLSVLVTGLVTAPVRRVTGYAPGQPINYSHRVHTGQMRIDCRYCHLGVEVSRHAAVPATSVCMNCHRTAALDKPDVVRLRNVYSEGEALEWKRVHRLPEFVYFSHKVHISAGVDCENCHGNVRQMDTLTQVSSLSMGSCLSCHRNAHVRVLGSKASLIGPENCTACHR